MVETWAMVVARHESSVVPTSLLSCVAIPGYGSLQIVPNRGKEKRYVILQTNPRAASSDVPGWG